MVNLTEKTEAMVAAIATTSIEATLRTIVVMINLTSAEHSPRVAIVMSSE